MSDTTPIELSDEQIDAIAARVAEMLADAMGRRRHPVMPPTAYVSGPIGSSDDDPEVQMLNLKVTNEGETP